MAEDCGVTHDLLKLLLNRRGHVVDIAGNGREALEALRNNAYDVALLDYHLPQIDGLQVAATLRAEAHERRPPRLIAITADPEGLLRAEAGCENFDCILPKPLDINQVGRLVEEQAELGDGAASAAVQFTPHAPVIVTARPTILDGFSHNILSWPDDLQAGRLSRRAIQATLGDTGFDAIVIKSPASVEDLGEIWRSQALFALPVIDLTGTFGNAADLDASKLKKGETAQIESLVWRFHERRGHLHRDILLSDELEDRLLGRVFVSGKPLTAKLDSHSRACFSYNVTLNVKTAAREAESLRAAGLLEREFVERFFACSHCNSDHIHVRKTCPNCHSSNLDEEQYLRHHRCGYQGPRSEYRQGLHLVCPKCQRALVDFGVDYDQAETMVVCRTCGHSGSKSIIEMICLDCSANYAWDGCKTRDAFSYELTDQGMGFAEFGRSFLGLFQKPLRFNELPQELVMALNDAAKAFNAHNTPFTLINIFYRNERRITAEQGAAAFAEARDKSIETLRSALSGSRLVVRGPSSYDFALLPGVGPHQAESDFPRLRAAALSTSNLDLGAALKAFGPQDF